MTDATFDWPGLMRAGLVGLSLKPAEFWALTPVELLLLLGIEGGQPPMARARLNELAKAFPDRATANRPHKGDE